MKGFAGLLFVFALIILAGIMLSLNYDTKAEASHKEILTETKMFTSTLSIMLSQVATDCNTKKFDINFCIDSNATMILPKIKPAFLDCNKTNSTKNGADNNIAYFTLNCKGEIASNDRNALYIDINKFYSIKK